MNKMSYSETSALISESISAINSNNHSSGGMLYIGTLALI
jgi:hypothetical protein